MGEQKSGLATWLPAFIAAEREPEAHERWVGDTTAAILEQVPEVTRVEGLADRVRETVDQNWTAFLAQLDEDELRFELVPMARTIAAQLATSQLSLETLVRFYRVAQQTTWAYITGVAGNLPPGTVDQAALLIYFWDRASQWIDRSITDSIEIYQAAHARAQAGAAAQRHELVLEVLDGRHDDPRLVSSGLGGYPVSVVHTALVLSCDDHDRMDALEQRVHEIARLLEAARPLVLRPGGRRLWAWVATRDEPDLDRIAPAAVGCAEQRVRVGVGTPQAGLAGFVASHREAEGALRVAGAGAVPHLCRYDEVALLVLLGCTPEVDRFVVRTLGPLAADDDAAARLRETLAALLACGGSYDGAAERLRVHRNTVRYRIAQVEKALGVPVARLGDGLGVALQHLGAFHAESPITA